MKTIFELNRYYIRRTLTSTRLVMPLVVTVVFCGIFYNENGINPYSSFAATIMLSFAIVGWSVHVLQKQEALEEQKKGLGYVVDCTIEETELVRPMVNGGTHITEFLVN